MKEITDVKELKVGEYYHLFNKRDNTYYGLDKFQENILSTFKGKPVTYFGHRIWTHEGNNQGMDNWHIFGPVQLPTIESLRLRDGIESPEAEGNEWESWLTAPDFEWIDAYSPDYHLTHEGREYRGVMTVCRRPKMGVIDPACVVNCFGIPVEWNFTHWKPRTTPLDVNPTTT